VQRVVAGAPATPSTREKPAEEDPPIRLKDRAGVFDDHYPCTRKGCDLKHVWNWLKLFADMHYARSKRMTFGDLVGFLEGGDGA
jgi:hypothetical protein